MDQMTGTSPTQPSHFVALPDGARYEADVLPGPIADATTTPSEASLEVPTEASRAGRLLVGVDGSEASLRALAKAVDLARALNQRLQVVTTWKFLVEYADMGGAGRSPEGDAREILLEALGRQFGSTPPEWVSSAILQGGAAQRLIEASTGAEMLVVGSRGHSGVVGLLLGSVSAECAEKAHCPVLVVH